jgi:uncharacterized protein
MSWIHRYRRSVLPRGATTLAAGLCLWTAFAAAQEGIPTDRLLRSLRPAADVNDFAGVLTPAQQESLEARCRQLREKTGAELAVVTIKSLEGGQIDDFAVRLFEQWGIGQKDRDNGVLLLVALEDRKARIEVGYGLEPILPDALAGRVLNDQLFPAFKQQKYGEGLAAAVERLAAIIEKNEPAPAQLRRKADPPGTFITVLILAVFVAIGSFALGVSLNRPPGCLIPLVFVAIPIFIGLAIAFPLAPLVHVPLSLVMMWLGWQARQDPRNRRRRAADWNTGPAWDTWTFGGSGGSGWSGGGFSGGGSSWGGFSGGSSGGGGASGSW